MSVSTNENMISVTEWLSHADLRRFCAALFQLIEKRRYPDVCFDFSRCEGATQQVMLPLMPLLAHYREKHDVEFQLYEPAQNDSLRRLFANANWGHYINPNGFDHRDTLHEGGHVPASQYDSPETESKLHRKVMDLVFENLEVDSANLKVLEWSLWEIMNNVSNHAESPVGGFVQATAFTGSNTVEFVVADGGIGIPESMKENDHQKAIFAAISEGVTRDKENNAGNGLYGSYRAATMSGGQFEINSYYGHFFQDGMEQSSPIKEKVPYKGTSVRCAIGLSDPELLNKALRFRGKAWDPHSAYLEKFGIEEEEMIFSVKEKAGAAFGSRGGGQRVRTQIENLLRDREQIVLDFEGVGVISSSFADEVFGRLFADMGFSAFTRRIVMRHVDPTVGGLIDRAIEQRVRLGNGKPDAAPPEVAP